MRNDQQGGAPWHAVAAVAGVISAAAAVLGLLGVFSRASSSESGAVAPAAYVRSLCESFAPFEAATQQRSRALDLSKVQDAVDAKRLLVSFLDTAEIETDGAVTELQAAGKPDVPNGDQIAATIVSAFVGLRTTLRAATDQANVLPTDTPDDFKSSAAALGANVRNSMAIVESSLTGLQSLALKKAAAAEPACRNLGDS